MTDAQITEHRQEQAALLERNLELYKQADGKWDGAEAWYRRHIKRDFHLILDGKLPGKLAAGEKELNVLLMPRLGSNDYEFVIPTTDTRIRSR
jgi:hypothetical protein